jgi:hypothetical protein
MTYQNLRDHGIRRTSDSLGKARRGKRARRRLKRPAGNAGRGSGGRRRPDVLARWPTRPIELTRWPTGPDRIGRRPRETGARVARVTSGMVWSVGAGRDRPRPRDAEQHDAGAGAPLWVGRVMRLRLLGWRSTAGSREVRGRAERRDVGAGAPLRAGRAMRPQGRTLGQARPLGQARGAPGLLTQGKRGRWGDFPAVFRRTAAGNLPHGPARHGAPLRREQEVRAAFGDHYRGGVRVA